MGQTSDQIERHIEETRGQLGEDLNELQTKVKEATDWRCQFQRHPKTALGIAFAGGIALAMVGSRPGPHGSGEQRANGDIEPKISKMESHVHQGSEVWNNVKSALLGLTAAHFTKVLDDVIPGFQAEYSRAKRDPRLG